MAPVNPSGLLCHRCRVRLTPFMRSHTKTLLEVVTGDVVVSYLVPVLRELRADKIPNVRLNVAICLEKALPTLPLTIRDQLIRPILEKLTADSDRDVKFYAYRAINVGFQGSSV